MLLDELFSSPLFASITPEQKNEFLKTAGIAMKSFKKDEFLAYQGDDIIALYFLCEGSVKTQMVTSSGDVLSIESISAPSPLAPAFLFTETPMFPVDIVAAEDCKLALTQRSY